MDSDLHRKLVGWLAGWTLASIPFGSPAMDRFDGDQIPSLKVHGAMSDASAFTASARPEGTQLAQFRSGPDSDIYEPGEPDVPGRGGGDGGGSRWIGPAVVGGVAALGLINALLKSESKAAAEDPDRMPSDPVRELLRNGPQLPSQFNTSAFAIRGLVRAGWPVVVDYESRSRGELRLQISARGTEVITYDLTKFGPGRHTLRFNVPPQLGDRLKPGLVAILATTGDGRRTLPDYRLYALGLGPKAVGSVGIDQLAFDPSSIRAGRSQTASYKFFSRSDFDHVAVEFFRVLGRSEGQANQRVDSDLLPEGVRRNQWIDDPDRYYWDGIDKSGGVSRGDHTLQVRAWAGTGDWVGAWSRSLLTVRD